MKEFLEWWEAGDLDVVVVSVYTLNTSNGYILLLSLLYLKKLIFKKLRGQLTVFATVGKT